MGTFRVAKSGTVMTPACRQGFLEATSIAPANWENSQGPMLPRQKHIGRCRLCGEQRPLTKEHVPPRAVGNKGAHNLFTFQDWIDRSGDDLALGSGRKGGGGVWGFTLCGPCNSWTGGEYVTAFRDWYGAFAQLVSRLPPARERDQWPETPKISFGLEADPGSVVRQALASFVSLGGEWELTERFPVLRQLICDKTTGLLPPGVRLFVAVASGPRARLVGPMLLVEQTGEWTWIMELAHPPVVFTLVVASNHRDHHYGAEISSFTLARPGRLMEVDLREVPVGFTWSPYATDLRSTAQILADRDIAV